jgi:hypothetical protein
MASGQSRGEAGRKREPVSEIDMKDEETYNQSVGQEGFLESLGLTPMNFVSFLVGVFMTLCVVYVASLR